MWMPHKLHDFPPNAKIIASTWAMNKKSNGKYQSRINAIGYEQVEGLYYDAPNSTSPVTNDMVIRIGVVLTLMAGGVAKHLDVKGVFLHGEFDEIENKIYMAVSEGFEDIYKSDVVLMLLKTIYGLKNVEKKFWKDLLRAFSVMVCRISNAYTYMYFKWDAMGLFVWLLCIDYCACFGIDD